MTILGSHTLAELRDLLNAYNYQYDQLSRAAQGAMGQWSGQDPAGATQWQSDFKLWSDNVWTPARSAANTALNNTPTILQSTTTDEATYQALAAAFAPLADLDRRMRAGPVAAAAPSYDQNPQPSATDADLGAFKAADAGVAAMPDPVKKLVGAIDPSVVPQNKDAGSYATSTTSKVLIALGAVLGLGLLIKIAK